ncbi:PmoA family protein [Plantibacter sp. LMC-P-059a]|uniref:DUF6807 domain-containing protein n=1 Tax=Plantibacter sp. LMC-P-059a TaxID=3040297 RepID=UPI00254FB7BA|nr:PmoA family protein [Plantibacter sp. LMC-P-059a]
MIEHHPSTGLALTHEVGSAVTVHLDGVEILRYTYRPDTVQRESPKPYLHPVRTAGGALVTLARPHDHVWHTGFAWALPHVGDDNFWGGPTFTGTAYEQLENNGRSEHVAVTAVSAEPDEARFAHTLAWITEGGRRIVDEERALTVRPVADAWTLTFETRMRNVSGRELSIGSPTTKGRENAGYGGLFWRGPRSFTGGTLYTPDGSGGDELRGTRHAWMGFTGLQDGTAAASSVVMVDDERNPAHPPQWFARTEEFAGLCPAPFFSEELPFRDEETLEFRYAVVIADGDGADGRAASLARSGRDALRRTPPA